MKNSETIILSKSVKISSIFCLLLILIIIGCEKEKVFIKESPKQRFLFNTCLENCINVEGKVIDAATDQPIEGAEVVLSYKTKNYLGETNLFISKFQSDENGEYDLNFTADSIDICAGSFNLFISYPTKHTQDILLDHRRIELGSTYRIVSHLLPEGRLDIKIKNERPKDENDKLELDISCVCSKYRDSDIISDFEDVIEYELNQIIEGRNIDMTNSYVFPPDESIVIKYTATKKGINYYYLDSIVIKSGEVFEYDLKY